MSDDEASRSTMIDDGVSRSTMLDAPSRRYRLTNEQREAAGLARVGRPKSPYVDPLPGSGSNTESLAEVVRRSRRVPSQNNYGTLGKVRSRAATLEDLKELKALRDRISSGLVPPARVRLVSQLSAILDKWDAIFAVDKAPRKVAPRG